MTITRWPKRPACFRSTTSLRETLTQLEDKKPTRVTKRKTKDKDVVDSAFSVPSNEALKFVSILSKNSN